MSEIRYVNFDAETVWNDMLEIYYNNGGDTLYRGDEKEMLLRSVQEILVQSAAVQEFAARMRTLRYAKGEYLDIIGEIRGVSRIKAKYARIKANIIVVGNGEIKISKGTIFKGSVYTQMGHIYYELAEDESIYVTDNTGIIATELICMSGGEVGNYEPENSVLYPITQGNNIIKAISTSAATGGEEEEDDDAYRNRIRNSAIINSVTGTKLSYEAKTMGVSVKIKDCNAVRNAEGGISIYIMLKEGETLGNLIKEVTDSLNGENERPLSDLVNVAEAKALSYNLTINYTAENAEKNSRIIKAVAEFKEWQESKIGIVFNPFKLIAAIYTAGAGAVKIMEESRINGSAIISFANAKVDEYWKGNINISKVEAIGG